MSYRNLVEGKRVAVVGPAPAEYDQAAEVDAHDVVIRVGFDHWPWPGYGDRVDVAVLDHHHSKLLLEGRFGVPDGVWTVLKFVPNPSRPGMHVAPWQDSFNPLQLTLCLNDLTRFGPADVTVFGADFYTDPHRAYADSDYEFVQTADRVEGKRWARLILGKDGTPDDHSPKQDLALIRDIRRVWGWPNGDDRFLRVLGMSDDEYDRATEGWL